MLFQVTVSCLLSAVASAAYSVSGHNVAAYWGQGANQLSLGEYCSQGNMDIVLLSFVNTFGTSALSFNFGNADLTKTASDIKTCQSAGIKVMLSLGGAVGSYGVSDSSMASDVADDLYTQFGPEGTVFPDATIDGFDLDIEAGTATGYPALVSAIKSKFGEGTLISAAPQCVYPDAYVGDALKEADIDMAFIQFYNNNCNLIGSNFNWDTWTEAVTNSFKNKDMKLYIGLPGSSVAAGSGYADSDTVKSKSASAIQDSQFGGFMVWDASYASNNDNFLGKLKTILGSSPAATTSATPTIKANAHTTVTATASPTTVRVTTTLSKVSSTSSFSSSTLNTAIVSTTSSVATVSTEEPSVMTNISWAVTSSESLMTNVLWDVTTASS